MKTLRAGLVFGIGAAFLACATGQAEGSSVKNRGDRQGWTWVTEQDSRSRVARIWISLRSGGLSDPAKLPGLAHFTARALLRGTRTRPYKDLTDAIERMGASVSVGTDLTQSTISATVLASNLDAFLFILRDVMTQPAFDAREMVQLQGILQGERKSRLQDPRYVASRAALERTYAGTPAAAPPLGTQESIAKITPQDSADFFKARFVRENMVIAVSSPFAPADIEARIARELEPVPHGAADAPALPLPTVTGRRAVIVDRKGMATVPLYIAIPGVSDAEADLPVLEVGNFVFGADFTSRLMQILRNENGWTYGAYAGYDQLINPKKDATLFSLYTFPSAEFAALAVPAALRLLDEYVKKGVSDEEFRDARDALSNRYPFEVDTASKRLDLKLRQILTGRPYETTEQYRARLAAVSLEQVNASVARLTPTSNMVISAVGDADALKPVLAGLEFVESVEVREMKP